MSSVSSELSDLGRAVERAQDPLRQPAVTAAIYAMLLAFLSPAWLLMPWSAFIGADHGVDVAGQLWDGVRAAAVEIPADTTEWPFAALMCCISAGSLIVSVVLASGLPAFVCVRVALALQFLATFALALQQQADEPAGPMSLAEPYYFLACLTHTLLIASNDLCFISLMGMLHNTPSNVIPMLMSCFRLLGSAVVAAMPYVMGPSLLVVQVATLAVKMTTSLTLFRVRHESGTLPPLAGPEAPAAAAMAPLPYKPGTDAGGAGGRGAAPIPVQRLCWLVSGLLTPSIHSLNPHSPILLLLAVPVTMVTATLFARHPHTTLVTCVLVPIMLTACVPALFLLLAPFYLVIGTGSLAGWRPAAADRRVAVRCAAGVAAAAAVAACLPAGLVRGLANVLALALAALTALMGAFF